MWPQRGTVSSGWRGSRESKPRVRATRSAEAAAQKNAHDYSSWASCHPMLESAAFMLDPSKVRSLKCQVYLIHPDTPKGQPKSRHALRPRGAALTWPPKINFSKRGLLRRTSKVGSILSHWFALDVGLTPGP
jgi:hypothetical protein